MFAATNFLHPAHCVTFGQDATCSPKPSSVNSALQPWQKPTPLHDIECSFSAVPVLNTKPKHTGHGRTMLQSWACLRSSLLVVKGCLHPGHEQFCLQDFSCASKAALDIRAWQPAHCMKPTQERICSSRCLSCCSFPHPGHSKKTRLPFSSVMRIFHFFTTDSTKVVASG